MIQGFVLPALSDPDKRTLIRGSLAIAFLLLVSKGLPAYRAWAHDTAAARDEELGDAARGSALLASLPAIRDSLRARSGRALALAPTVLEGDGPGAASATLASLVTDAASDAGVSLGTLETRGDLTNGVNLPASLSARHHALVTVSVHGVLTGDVVGVGQFLSELEDAQELSAVRDLSISQPEPAAGSNQMETLHAEFTVVGLALAPESPRSAPPTVATRPPSTRSTSSRSSQ